METAFSKTLKYVINALLYLAIFLVPIFFLPFTAEILEFNKYFLFYALIFLALLLWVGRGVLLRRFEFKRTPLDVPLIILWAVALLTSIISQDRYISFFGDFSSLGLSFLGLTAFLIFYFLMVQHIDSMAKILRIIYYLLISGFFSAIYFISHYFIAQSAKLVKFIPGNFPQFNPVSASNGTFGVFLVILMVLSLTFLVIRKKDWGVDILAVLTFFSCLAGVVLIGFKIVWVILAVALFILIVFLLSQAEIGRKVWITIGFAVLVFGIVFIILGVPNFLVAKLPAEVALSPGASASILKSTITHSARYFLFGSGLGTFPYNFSQFRPLGLNTSFAWNIRFQQSHNSAMDWLMANGLLGGLGMLLILLLVLGLVLSTWLRQVLGSRRNKGLAGLTDLLDSPLIFWGLTVGWLTSAIAFFFINFGIVHWLIFWLLLGLMMQAGAHLFKKELPQTIVSLKTTPQYSLVTSFAFILVFISLLVLGIYLGRFFAGEVVYAKAVKMSVAGEEGLNRLNYLQKAMKYNPLRVIFYLSSAENYLFKAQEVSNQGGDVNQVAQLVASAINTAKAGNEKAPYSVVSWELLATMYANARAITPEANTWVTASLEKALSLEPTNPVFYLGLGNAKLLERRYTEAKEDFEKAISLKPDLLPAYALLATVYEIQNDVNKAIEIMERGLSFGRDDITYIFRLGRYYFNRHQDNDWALSELAWKRVVSLNPYYSDALFSLGTLYEKQNKRSEALSLFQRVLELNPGNKQVVAKINSLTGPPETPGELKKK